MQKPGPKGRSAEILFSGDAFSRHDERVDEIFYQSNRFVDHLDAHALGEVERILGSLIIEERPAILDLMCGWNSHLPASVRPHRMVGLGLNQAELEKNATLDECLVHDVNICPTLPFSDATFDVVTNICSVAYLTRPFDVFDEVARVLKPGGLFLVVFSNRLFQAKAVKVWRDASEPEQEMIVEDYFSAIDAFEKPEKFISLGRPRAKDDKLADLGLPSDPVYALFAEKRGRAANRGRRPCIEPAPIMGPSPAELAQRKKEVHRTLRCPYCEESLTQWEIPPGPFTEWPDTFFYVCLNNDCSYLIEGWDVMARQGSPGFSYRLMYVPRTDRCMPTPVPSVRALRQEVVAPRG